MAKKTTKNNGLVSDVFGFGADLLSTGADIIGGTAKIINKLAGKTIEASDVIAILNEIKITEAQYTTEKNIEKIISDKIDDYYDVHRQYNIGGFLGLKIDIDVNESVGIELKLAKELTTTNIERLLGQVLYYSRRKYKSKLIVVIVGSAKEANSRIIEELQDIIEEQDVNFYFLKTIKSRSKL